MSTEPHPGCTLILAAGVGQRYRQHDNVDKLLVPSRACTPHSPPVLVASLIAYAQLTERCVLVLADDNSQRQALARRHASQWGVELLTLRSNGLGHSLAQAIAHTASSPGWLVALADMPYVQRATLETLAAQIDEHALHVPSFAGHRGHPRVIGSHYANELLRLQGDQGAQHLFRLPAAQEIVVDDLHILRDIDRPSDRLP